MLSALCLAADGVHADVSDRAAGQQLTQHLVVHALAIAACGTMSGNRKLVDVG